MPKYVHQNRFGSEGIVIHNFIFVIHPFYLSFLGMMNPLKIAAISSDVILVLASSCVRFFTAL